MYKKKYYLHKLKTNPSFGLGSSSYLIMLLDLIKKENKTESASNSNTTKEMLQEFKA